MTIKRYSLSAVCLLALLRLLATNLSGCAMFGHHEATATVNLSSVNYLNPDVNGRASPVMVTVYQLKTPYAFKQATFDQLINNSGALLGTSLLDKQTIAVKPNTNQQLSIALANQTLYVGVVAAYRNITHATWHQIVRILANKNNIVDINLESQGVMVTTRKAGFLS